MAVLNGKRGRYDTDVYEDRPPKEYRNWDEVVDQNGIPLKVGQTLTVLLER